MDRNDVQPLTAASADRLDRLFRLYSSRVLAYAATRAKRPADADDIAGLAWVKAATTVNRLKGSDEAALPWLMCITFRAAATYYAPKRASEQPQDWTDAVASWDLPNAAPADADALVFAVLTPRQAAVWKLKSQGMSDRRIALRLGRSETAIWKRKHAGARRLRSSLALAR
ncbi:RNA polymerase sigma factor [Streptomyces sp. 24-1644]|uniref:RNA polymerase sigma factor n=1 Tax=Streptomyces sp. 24-1644 TaxID=3457315 RepID=UPI003FA729EC